MKRYGFARLGEEGIGNFAILLTDGITFDVTVTSANVQCRGTNKRAIINLYNARPTWLELAHRRLDEAVLAAYGWPSDLSDEEILEKPLSLGSLRSASGVLRKFGEGEASPRQGDYS